MERPKLTKKHATFDSYIPTQQQQRTMNMNDDLNNDHDMKTTTTTPDDPHHLLIKKTKPTHEQTNITKPKIPPKNDLAKIQHHQTPPPPPPTNRADEINNNENNETDNNNQRLSKLTLSSSLHLLNDSKFINNQQQQQQQTTNSSNDDKNNEQPEINAQTNTNRSPNSNHPIHEFKKQYSISSKTISTKCQPNTNTNTNTNGNKKQEANLDTVHVVVGNEACDLDSAVSCLLLFHIISKISDEINGKDKTKTLYIPLLNTSREMLDSKSEVLWFLQKTLNIDKSFLTCKDDIDWAEIKRNGIEILITLVDHNYNEEFKDIGRIVEIIDHHQVQNPIWLMEQHQNIRLTLDTSVGSCTTLVAERLFYIYAEHHVSDEILLLIYGTILLDTICLSEKAKRFTRRDVYLLRKLDALLGNRKPNREELYKQLVSAKNSTRELNFEKLMRRDLKIYKDKNGLRIGIASLFGMAAKEALGLAANINLDQFFCQNNYEAFIIMGLIADLEQSDGISRDLVLISANEKLFELLCGVFENDTNKLDLDQIGGPRSSLSPDPEDDRCCIILNHHSSNDSSSKAGSAQTPNINQQQQHPKQTQQQSGSVSYRTRIWIQRNVTSSRKVVAPLVLKVLHDGAWN